MSDGGEDWKRRGLPAGFAIDPTGRVVTISELGGPGDPAVRHASPTSKSGDQSAAPEDGAAEVVGYMCRIDWECELGSAWPMTPIYPSIATLKEQRKCVTYCGIVAVSVRITRVVEEGESEVTLERL